MDKKQNQPANAIYQQFQELKTRHKDSVLLFRSGDTYHLYGNDADRASTILGININNSELFIAPDGTIIKEAVFPWYELDCYLPKLIRNGCRVAICDQLQ